MVIIRKIKTAFRLMKTLIIRKKETRRLIRETDAIENLSKIERSNIIILMPHADDEWIGCSRLIQKYSESVFLVNVNMPGDGETIEIHNKRYEELLKVIRKYHLQHATLLENFNFKVDELSKMIIEIKPKYIALPCYIDWHDEHIETMRILKAALEKLNENAWVPINILMYQVSVPMPPNLITNYEEMTKREHKLKWKFLNKIYRTQKNIQWSRFRCNERINGALCNSFAAEVYSVLEASKWIDNLDNFILNKEKRMAIKENLNDLVYVRKYVENI